ncbi:probable G-protein coupled receptor 34 [Cyprinodon tularosa]|uniref:probable G-protein coupled receptor 34 n=1 Tax=Cyprinodon tularosa TaxID=77115 RepID=UPI0018E1F9C8|nr:probable G-protein coupled receptor 34 [Cyprinodon tularosa]
MENQTLSNTNISGCVDDELLRTPLAALYSAIFILGLPGNLLALWVFLCVHSKKNSMRVFLINLALADLLLIVCLPFRIQYHVSGNQWKLVGWLCKLVGYLFYMNMYISITLLGLISVDRYLRIYGSVRTRSKLQSPLRSMVVCAFVWLVSLALMIPVVVYEDYEESTEKCFHYRKTDVRKASIKLFIVVVFWLIFTALMVSYGKIGQKLLKRSHQNSNLPNASHYSRIARKSFFILFVFIVCFVPYHIFRGFYIKTQITDSSCYWRNLADKFNEISLVFSALNSCLDPIMFFLLSASVRREVRRFMNSMFRTRVSSEASGGNTTSELDSRRPSKDPMVRNLTEREERSCSSN